MVFAGDSEQQKRGECSFSIADQLGREVLNGVYQGALPDRNNCNASDIMQYFHQVLQGLVKAIGLIVRQVFRLKS